MLMLLIHQLNTHHIGFLELVAPGGLRINLFSGIRRDPMMFVALKVRDMKKSIKWYTDTLGMQQMPYPKVNMHAETHIQVTCR
jgi:hypothetical protein